MISPLIKQKNFQTIKPNDPSVSAILRHLKTFEDKKCFYGLISSPLPRKKQISCTPQVTLDDQLKIFGLLQMTDKINVTNAYQEFFFQLEKQVTQQTAAVCMHSKLAEHFQQLYTQKYATQMIRKLKKELEPGLKIVSLDQL